MAGPFSLGMEYSAQSESSKCCELAAAMRLDATRAAMPVLAARLLRGAEDPERHAIVLRGWTPYVF